MSARHGSVVRSWKVASGTASMRSMNGGAALSARDMETGAAPKLLVKVMVRFTSPSKTQKAPGSVVKGGIRKATRS